MTPEAISKINALRQKMAQGMDITLEEQIEAVRLLRASRFSAASASAVKGKARAAKATILDVNGDDLLGEIMA